MAEKILNTRIQLKYDTLANWNASSFKLKAGELAIVTLGEAKDGSTAGTVNQHPVLFKVGTGEHTFAQLPYASALAADVYAWAKASTVKLEGKSLKFVDAEGKELHKVDIPYITENEANTLISTALASYSTTEQMNAAIKVEADRAKAAEEKIATFGEDGKLNGGALFTEVNSLDGRIDTLEEHVGDSTKGLLKDVADLKTAVGEGGSVDSKIANAIADLDAEKSQAAGADGLALSITEVDGKITAISGSIAAETYDAYGSAAAAQSAAIAAAKTETENQITALVTTGAVKANTDAIAAINKADTGILAQAKAYTDEVKDNLLGEGIKDTFDTLVEIQNWIEGDGVNATELTNAIAAEAARAKAAEEKIAKFDENGALTGGALFTEVNDLQGQIDALGIVDGKVEAAAKADVASSLDAAGIAQVKGIKVDNATNADVANSLTDAAKAEVKAVKVDNATHADAAAKVDNALTIKTEDGTEVVYDGSAVKSVDLTGLATKAYADQAEADAKAYADGLAGNYATAAQGAKADSALQTIEAGTGLKVSAKAENKQTIDIDESVVFIFDCGSASKNIN